LSPDIIVCRCSEDVSRTLKQKISVFCHVPPSNILSVYDVSNIYHVPLILEQQGLSSLLRSSLRLEDTMLAEPQLSSWKEMAQIVDNLSERVEIAIVGKYTGLQDCYLSLIKALKHSSILLKVDIVPVWIDASDLEDSSKESHREKYDTAWSCIHSAKGILVPGGFGSRGTLGKIAATRYARENKVPFLGICLGMQIMVIEYARNVLMIENANSVEFDEATPYPVIVFMPEINPLELGGTMRLGAKNTIISSQVAFHDSVSPSLSATIYGLDGISSSANNPLSVSERHRHRYEVNPERIAEIERKGLIFTGKDEMRVRMEMAELPRSIHPFFFGTQCHPEYKSRPGRPSPPFFAFAAVAAGRISSMSLAGKLWQEKLHEQQSRFQPPSGSAAKRKRSDLDCTSPNPRPAPLSTSFSDQESRLENSSVVYGVSIKSPISSVKFH
jgi:CTP synthase